MNTKHRLILGSFAIAYVLIIFSLFFTPADIVLVFGLDNVNSSNYENVTVWTRVNVTNARPEILNLSITDTNTGYPNNVTLAGGSLRLVECNSSIRDWNGMDGNITVNATFFHITSTAESNDNNATHYTNSSCTNRTAAYGQNNVYKDYTCGFALKYYALNGTWACNVMVLDSKDDKNYTVNRTNTTFVYPLYALNITNGIDYGDMAVGDVSPERIANVSNFGNMDINLTVQGYGSVSGDAWAMVCNGSLSTSNISIDNQAFYFNATGLFGEMIPMNGSVQPVSNVTVPKRTDTTQTVFNSTYWKLYLDPAENPFGVCTGYVIFAARAS